MFFGETSWMGGFDTQYRSAPTRPISPIYTRILILVLAICQIFRFLSGFSHRTATSPFFNSVRVDITNSYPELISFGFAPLQTNRLHPYTRRTFKKITSRFGQSPEDNHGFSRSILKYALSKEIGFPKPLPPRVWAPDSATSSCVLPRKCKNAVRYWRSNL